MTIKEHDCVVLTADLPKEGLKARDVGTVVHIHGDGARVRSGIHDVRRQNHRRPNRGSILCPPCSRPGREPRPRFAVGVIAFVFLRLNV